jgi:hypothetical protein
MPATINYTIEVLHPDTGAPISLNVKKFNDWDQVTNQIIADKKQFVDMAHCTMKYWANDSQNTINGSFGA